MLGALGPRARNAQVAMYQSGEVDYSSLDGLLGSLKRAAPDPAFRRVERAEDYSDLQHLAAQREVRDRVDDARHVRLLWDLCQLPDCRQPLFSSHAGQVRELFVNLQEGPSGLSSDWLSRPILRTDHIRGDLDALTLRVAFIRTWNRVCSPSRWAQDTRHRRAKTRRFEDRLNDALHAKLVERFVDGERREQIELGRSSGRRARQREVLQGSPFARLLELREAFDAEPAPPADDWVEHLLEAPHPHFDIADNGTLA